MGKKMTFQDKVVWITGASSGIGAALARKMAERGAFLILSARRKVALQHVRDLICEAGTAGEKIVILPFDIVEKDVLDQVVGQAEQAFGRIDMLVNNAGISQRSFIVDTDMAVYQRLMDVNFFAPVALTRKVLPLMLAQGHGHIAVTSSVAGKVGAQFRAGYCASKHAVMGFFDALRAEMAGQGIVVTTIVPGFIRTDISAHALQGDASPVGHLTKAIESGMDVDRAAEVIVRGFERGTPEITVGQGREMHALWLKRLAPRLLFKVSARVVAE